MVKKGLRKINSTIALICILALVCVGLGGTASYAGNSNSQESTVQDSIYIEDLTENATSPAVEQDTDPESDSATESALEEEKQAQDASIEKLENKSSRKDEAKVVSAVTNQTELEAAFATVVTGETIELGDDFKLSSQVTFPYVNFTLDGKGYTIGLEDGYTGAHFYASPAGAKWMPIIKNLTVKGHNSTVPEKDLSDRIEGGGINIYSSQGTVTFDNVTIIGIHGVGSGGGLVVSYGGTFYINNSKFQYNSATVGGGALYGGSSSSTRIYIDGSNFSHNYAGSEGGATNQGYGNLYMTDSTFTDNYADYAGGVIRQGSGLTTADNCTFKDNESGGNAGVIKTSGASHYKNSTFDGNHSGDYGGAIFVQNQNNTNAQYIEDSLFTSNSAVSVAGAMSTSETVITGGAFKYNSSRSSGAINGTLDKIRINGTDFEGNYASTGIRSWDLDAPKQVIGSGLYQTDAAVAYKANVKNVTSFSQPREEGYVAPQNAFNNYDINMYAFTMYCFFSNATESWSDGSNSSSTYKTFGGQSTSFRKFMSTEPSLEKEGYNLLGWEVLATHAYLYPYYGEENFVISYGVDDEAIEDMGLSTVSADDFNIAGPLVLTPVWGEIPDAEIEIVDDYRDDDGIIAIHRTGDTGEKSAIFQSGYPYTHDIQLKLGEDDLTAEELKDVTWKVEGAGGYPDPDIMKFVTVTDAAIQVKAEKSGIVKLTAQYKGTESSIHIVIPGDITRDGLLNSLDSAKIQLYSMSKKEEDLGVVDDFTMFIGDINGDGLVNTQDSAIIQSMSASSIKPSN